MKKRDLYIFIIAALLTGCSATAPAPSEGILQFDLPDTFASSGDAMGGTDREWVADFRDSKLNGMVKEVLANNFDLERAASRVEQAGADAKIAGARMLPVVDVGLDGARQQQAFIGFPTGGGPGGVDANSSLSNRFGLSTNIRWELDLWGRIRTGQSAAIAELQASSVEFQGVQTSLAAQTTKIWFALIEAEKQLALAKNSLKSLTDSEQTIRDQFQIAVQPGAQLRLVMSDVAQAEAQLQEREMLRLSASRQLEVLLGRYPKGEIKAGVALPAMPKMTPVGIPSDVLYRRADLIAAERRIAASDKRILEAKLALLPQISLTGSGGSASGALRDLTSKGTGVWSIGGALGQTVLAGGEVLANVSKRKSVAREALANYQSTALSVFQEVENGLTADTYMALRLVALVKSETLLVDAYKESLSNYKDGVGDVLTVLLAQRQMIQTQAAVLSLKRLRLDSRVDLHVALGGKFTQKKLPETRRSVRKESKKEN
jgi:multidrug efflux system outer membrane protein